MKYCSKKRIILTGTVLLLVTLAGCGDDTGWHTEPEAQITDTDDKRSITVEVGYGGFTTENTYLKNIHILFLENNSEPLQTKTLGTVESAEAKSLSANFSAPPAWILIQPGSVENAPGSSFNVGGFQWNGERYVEELIIDYSANENSWFGGPDLSCTKEIACEYINTSSAGD